MQHICPYCNALATFQAACSQCGQNLTDTGRLADYYGDYSPYREIDDSKLTNGYNDLANALCIHVGWCEHCHREQLLAIREWDGQTLLQEQLVFLEG